MPTIDRIQIFSKKSELSIRNASLPKAIYHTSSEHSFPPKYSVFNVKTSIYV